MCPAHFLWSCSLQVTTPSLPGKIGICASTYSHVEYIHVLPAGATPSSLYFSRLGICIDAVLIMVELHH